jgi:hypothetical protein
MSVLCKISPKQARLDKTNRFTVSQFDGDQSNLRESELKDGVAPA